MYRGVFPDPLGHPTNPTANTTMKTQNLLKTSLLAGAVALAMGFASSAFGQTILVDCGADGSILANGSPTSSPDINGNTWNNSIPSAMNVANLKSTANSATGISLTWTNVGSGANTNPLGATAAPGLLNIATAYQDAIFTTTTTPGASFYLGGLDPSKTYTISLFGSRDDSTTVRYTTYTVTGASALTPTTIQTTGLNVGGTGINHNIANLATFSNVVPNGSNDITVNYVVGAGSTASFGYLNAMEITVVPEPATWGLLAFSLTTVMVLRRRRS